MDVLEFTILGELPTMNEIVKKSKQHYMSYANMKKKYTRLVAESCKHLPKVKQADFEIIWICKDRRKDKDNITAGQKFIFDGIIQAGIMQNDGWGEVGNISHFFQIDKKNPRIIVRLRGDVIE